MFHLWGPKLRPAYKPPNLNFNYIYFWTTSNVYVVGRPEYSIVNLRLISIIYICTSIINFNKTRDNYVPVTHRSSRFLHINA